jgi:hypothetical protein
VAAGAHAYPNRPGCVIARLMTREHQPRSRIDEVLRQGVDTGAVAGVVAMAANDEGVLYEGAAGLRALD